MDDQQVLDRIEGLLSALGRIENTRRRRSLSLVLATSTRKPTSTSRFVPSRSLGGSAIGIEQVPRHVPPV